MTLRIKRTPLKKHFAEDTEVIMMAEQTAQKANDEAERNIIINEIMERNNAIEYDDIKDLPLSELYKFSRKQKFEAVLKKRFSISSNEEYSLLRLDENAFNIINYVTECLKKEKLDALVVPFQKRAIDGGHDNLMTVAQRYLDMANNAARKRIARKAK